MNGSATERPYLRCAVCDYAGPDVTLYRERADDLTFLSVPYCSGPGMFQRHDPARLRIEHTPALLRYTRRLTGDAGAAGAAGGGR